MTPDAKVGLVAWYRVRRRDLPWRRTADPYAVWVSETMLQQTRVDAVVPYYERFLAALPTVNALAEAPSEQVLSLWSGLGYYRRARMLHAAAKRVVHAYAGRMPRDAVSLRSLDGVGAYTAGAVASIAFGERAALVDGNVARVLARVYAITDNVATGRGRARVWSIAEELIATGDAPPGEWNQALMELGATVCLPRAPRCEACPLLAACLANARGLVQDLPRSSPKRTPARMAKVAVIASSAAGILLARRKPDALFGGLWEPPMGDDAVALAARIGIAADDLTPCGHVAHVLTHRRLEIDVVSARLDAGQRGAPGATEFGLPGPEYDKVELVSWGDLPGRAKATLTRKLLEVANGGQRGLPFSSK